MQNVWTYKCHMRMFNPSSTEKFFSLSNLGSFIFFVTPKFCSTINPDNIYLFKVNTRNTRKRCAICSKLTKTSIHLLPANIYWFKVNNRNMRKRCKICSKLTLENTRMTSLRHESVLKKLAPKLSSNIGARGKILETLSCVTGNLTHNLA